MSIHLKKNKKTYYSVERLYGHPVTLERLKVSETVSPVRGWAQDAGVGAGCLLGYWMAAVDVRPLSGGRRTGELETKDSPHYSSLPVSKNIKSESGAKGLSTKYLNAPFKILCCLP